MVKKPPEGEGKKSRRQTHRAARKDHKDQSPQAKQEVEKYSCPPHAPFEWGNPDKDGKYKHQCSKCTRQLGVW